MWRGSRAAWFVALGGWAASGIGSMGSRTVLVRLGRGLACLPLGMIRDVSGSGFLVRGMGRSRRGMACLPSGLIGSHVDLVVFLNGAAYVGTSLAGLVRG